VILAASIFETSCGKADTQTNGGFTRKERHLAAGHAPAEEQHCILPDMISRAIRMLRGKEGEKRKLLS